MKKTQITLALLATLFITLTASAQGEWKWANYWSGTGGNPAQYYNDIVKTSFDEEGNIYVFGQMARQLTFNGSPLMFISTPQVYGPGKRTSLLAKFDTLGNMLWYKVVKSSESVPCYPFWMEVRDNKVYISGNLSLDYVENTATAFIQQILWIEITVFFVFLPFRIKTSNEFMKKILGIGNALVDILVHIDNDKILNRLGLQKGGMEMIDAQRKREILEVIAEMPQTIATGGSTSNTIHGLARLGSVAGYIGKVGNDDLGHRFREECDRFGVIPHLIESKEDTGVAITFISPNAERTFATYLGAAATMQPAQVDTKILENYDIIHIEGYLIFNHDLILDVCQKAKACGLQISMDMASYNLIESNLDFVKMLLRDYVDIIFANEEEAKAFTGVDNVEALRVLAEYCPIAIVKVGKDGSYIQMGREVTAVSPVVVDNPVDTTGAGDIYASGFLYGLVNGYDALKSGKLASYLAARLIGHVGAKLPDDEWVEANKQRQQL